MSKNVQKLVSEQEMCTCCVRPVYVLEQHVHAPKLTDTLFVILSFLWVCTCLSFNSKRNPTCNLDITNHVYYPCAFVLPSIFVRSKSEGKALKQQGHNDRLAKYQRTQICNWNYKPFHRIDVNITFFKSFWHRGFHPYYFHYITF